MQQELLDKHILCMVWTMDTQKWRFNQATLLRNIEIAPLTGKFNHSKIALSKDPTKIQTSEPKKVTHIQRSAF